MRHHRKIIYLAGFIFTIPVALTSYINSSFLETYLNSYYVSAVYIAASLFTILGLLEMPKLLGKIGNRKTIIVQGISVLISFLCLALGESKYIVVPAFILYFVSVGTIVASLDIFMEDFSKRTNIGTFRGFYLMILSISWVLAQLISGTIISKTSFEGLYLLSALFMLVFISIFFFSLRDFKDPIYKRTPIGKTFRLFLKNKVLSKIYFLALVLRFFFAWMVIYTPIYLNQYLGFGWDQIGIIFTIMLLPFVLLDYPLGKLSDRSGEKKMLLWGFMIMAISTSIIPFTHSKEVWVWALILFATRIGAATVEVMSEDYFFKYINPENADAINFYRNTGPVSYIIAPVIAIPVLFLVPAFQYLFLVLAAILLLGFFVTLRLRDIK